MKISVHPDFVMWVPAVLLVCLDRGKGLIDVGGDRERKTWRDKQMFIKSILIHQKVY